ncbi:hypothetical protein BpHYR1_050228 [Brachionus plicatilis]|uniref:Uncharacterized protein n=1 Tax=Brachionus plicatilis TaxID=10195 RepID=A0A3M7RJF5_BRAPC|nr:hypothetical protein BpHYR1_050228 [Brachionus plicatilis]
MVLMKCISSSSSSLYQVSSLDEMESWSVLQDFFRSEFELNEEEESVGEPTVDLSTRDNDLSFLDRFLCLLFDHSFVDGRLLLFGNLNRCARSSVRNRLWADRFGQIVVGDYVDNALKSK